MVEFSFATFFTGFVVERKIAHVHGAVIDQGIIVPLKYKFTTITRRHENLLSDKRSLLFKN